MAIFVVTPSPKALLTSIYKAIDDGHVVTWEYDADGDFTHATQPDNQWRHKAWMRPKTIDGALTFGIIKRKGEDLSKEVYAVYHGRFIEMLLAHFDADFSSAQATAQLVSPDLEK